MQYPGGKQGSGVYQRIINLMPPHETYIEPFLGGGAIMRLKRPALVNIGVDLDADVIAAAASTFPAIPAGIDTNGDTSGVIVNSGDKVLIGESDDAYRRTTPAPAMVDVRLLVGDGIGFLRSYHYSGREMVYCDPPYVLSSRAQPSRPIYRHEMTDEQHVELLDVLVSLEGRTRLMISGYWTQLYAKRLTGWNSIQFEVMTRGGGKATEWLWMNFDEPVALHDYSYLGSGFRERERIKRKKLRWVAKLKRMPLLERRALLLAIADTHVFDDAPRPWRSDIDGSGEGPDVRNAGNGEWIQPARATPEMTR